MLDPRISPLSEVLAEEYQALRSESSYAPSDPESSESALLAELFQKVHHQTQPFSALCISGGGTRSTTFALGALQGMVDHGFLGDFDYLSTVSGGGYIGSWLTAWIHRAGGLAQVAPHLKTNSPQPAPGDPDPIQHLRDHSNYLTPNGGFFSVDTWVIAATVMRNVVLNGLVLVPLLLFALMVPRLMVPFMNLVFELVNSMGWAWLIPATMELSYVLFALAVFNSIRYLPGIGWVRHTQSDLLLYVLIPLVLSAILQCVHYYLPGPITTFGKEVRQGLFEVYVGYGCYLLIFGWGTNRILSLLVNPITLLALPLVAIAIGTLSWILLTKIYELDAVGLSQFVTLGPPLLLIGLLLGGCLFVGISSGGITAEDREWFSRVGAWLLILVLAWFGTFSLVLLVPDLELKLSLGEWTNFARSSVAVVGSLSGLATALAGFSGKTKSGRDRGEPKAHAWKSNLAKVVQALLILLFSIGLMNLLVLFTSIISEWSNRNFSSETTSLTAVAALAAAFLLSALVTSRFINLNAFSLHAMYRDRLIRAYLGASNPKRNASLFTGFAENDNIRMGDIRTSDRPLHVLNLTLNLVAGERLAWQKRNAESFTVSPLHSGSSTLGYRSSTEYANRITLGTAMTISGATANPNIGYPSSPVMAFIMTLFSARLGAWLANPGVVGGRTWRRGMAFSGPGSLIKQVFGIINHKSNYVYLSDGGHFENLGLYEMVRRRCRHILVLDSSSDPFFSYEDLGNALRKIRIDMKIPIKFEEAPAMRVKRAQKRCAVARIAYSEVDGDCEDGYLLYVKPVFLGDEPPDVQSYHSANPDFPHQGSGDLEFDESQTESYRMLGLHTMDEICRQLQGDSMDDVRRAAKEYLNASA